MKYKVFLMSLLFVLSLNSLLVGKEKPIKYIPVKPKAGDDVLIKFNANDTELEAAENITVIIYSVVLDTTYCDEYPMVKSENGWEYEYTVPKTAWSVGVKFSDGDAEVDDDGFNFPMFLYDDSGQLLKGTRASFASLCLNRLATSQSERAKSYSLFKDEFAKNPELTKYFLGKYSFCMKDEEPDTWQETIKKIIANIDADKDGLDEKALAEMEYTYNYLLRDKQKAEEYRNIAIQKYPLGITAQTKAYNKIKQIGNDNVVELKNSILEYRKKFGDNTIYSTTLWDKLITVYCENKMYSELKENLSQNADELRSLSIMNSISSWAQTIVEKEGDVEFAKYLINFAYKLSKEYEPTNSEFRGDTEAQRKFKIGGYMSRTLYNAACVYEEAGEPEEALKFIEEAYIYDDLVVEIKILYAKLLVELNKDADIALATTVGLIKDSKVMTEITDLNKKAYMQVNGSDKGYEEYFDDLRRPLLDERREEIKTKMIKEPAADFSLKDLDGNIITLSELKGKIVIIDFWASWCMPCKASMPLMKDAVQKYADNQDVEFFFVDTFERGTDVDIIESAKKFIDNNDYPFHVLIDTNGKVAKEGYGITMIPAKVFIDKDGNKRLTSMGFDKKKLLDEIDILIQLLK